MKTQGNHNFLLLITGRLIASLSSSIFAFALSLYVLDLTGSATIFSTVLSFSIIPGIFVNLFGGALVDRFNKKKIIVISDLLSGIVMCAFAYTFFRSSPGIPTIIGFTIFISIIQSYYGLAMLSAIPEIIEQEKVSQANAYLQIMSTLLGIIGPVLGALAYKAFGMKFIILFDTVAYFISATMAIWMRFNLITPEKKAGTYLEDMREAALYLFEHKTLRFLLVICVIMNAVYLPMIMLVMPFINYQVIKVSGFQLSLIEAAWAIGGTLGGIYVSTRKATQPIIKKLFVLLSIQSVLLLLWTFPALPALTGLNKNQITFIFCSILAVTGLLNMIQNIPVLTHFQLRIPEHLRAKVLGFINVASMLSLPLGMWVFGILLGIFSWYYITAASALLMLFICLVSSRNKHFVKFSETL